MLSDWFANRKRGTWVNQTAHKRRYLEYIDSPGWKAKREQVFAERGRKCEQCGSEKRIQVHHRHYRNLFREELKDLQVLCKACHQKKHRDDILKKHLTRAKPLEQRVFCLKCGAGPKRLHWASSFEGHCFNCGAHFKLEVTVRKPRKRRQKQIDAQMRR